MHPHNAMHPLKPRGVHCIKIRVISQKNARRTHWVRLALKFYICGGLIYVLMIFQASISRSRLQLALAGLVEGRQQAAQPI